MAEATITQESNGPGKSSSGATATTNSTPTTESNTGLRNLMTDMLKKVAAKESIQAQTERLLIPNQHKWFQHVFGDALGATLAAEYEQLTEKIDTLASFFESANAKGQDVIDVISLTSADSPLAKGLQKTAIGAMKNPVKLYTVKFVKPGQTLGMSLWSFAFVDGHWRLVGKMRAIDK